MPRVQITPERVKAIASALRQRVEVLQARKSAVVVSFDGLREVWNDAQYRRFEAIFKQAAQDIDRFSRLGKNYADFLARKAEKAQRYQRGG